MSNAPHDPLADYVGLTYIARGLGSSYHAAHALAASGQLGEPLVIARSHFYRRSVADQAIARRLEQRRRGGRTAPIATPHQSERQVAAGAT